MSPILLAIPFVTITTVFYLLLIIHTQTCGGSGSRIIIMIGNWTSMSGHQEWSPCKEGGRGSTLCIIDCHVPFPLTDHVFCVLGQSFTIPSVLNPWPGSDTSFDRHWPVAQLPCHCIMCNHSQSLIIITHSLGVCKHVRYTWHVTIHGLWVRAILYMSVHWLFHVPIPEQVTCHCVA